MVKEIAHIPHPHREDIKVLTPRIVELELPSELLEEVNVARIHIGQPIVLLPDPLKLLLQVLGLVKGKFLE
jgi:hypothetical protein